MSSRQCDSFRRYLYEGLQCPQCVAPANAVAAASAVCARLTTPSLCVPEAAIAANFEDYSDLEDIAIAPSPDDFILASGIPNDLICPEQPGMSFHLGFAHYCVVAIIPYTERVFPVPVDDPR